MTAAIARVRVTYSNAGDHRENAANAAVAMVAIEPSTASHLSEVALCGAVSRYNEAVLPPGPSSYFNLTPTPCHASGIVRCGEKLPRERVGQPFGCRERTA